MLRKEASPTTRKALDTRLERANEDVPFRLEGLKA